MSFARPALCCNLSFAALTMASTSINVMSPWTVNTVTPLWCCTLCDIFTPPLVSTACLGGAAATGLADGTICETKRVKAQTYPNDFLPDLLWDCGDKAKYSVS